MNMDFKRKLTIPYDLKQEYPVTADMAQVFEQRDRELKDILGSRDSRLALIIGPCSADREDSVLDYVTRLVPIQEKVKDKLLIIPRVYTNKPRTTGAGYKGMLHQPDPNAAQHSHTFIYRGWEATSAGNPYAHAILRGYTNKHGESRPNYHYEDLIFLHRLYEEQGLKNPAVVIDANHANSGKNPYQQGRIIREVLQNRNCDHGAHDLVKGFMVESYLEDGNQKVDGGVYGKSITDACLGWEKTERLIYDIAELA